MKPKTSIILAILIAVFSVPSNQIQQSKHKSCPCQVPSANGLAQEPTLPLQPPQPLLNYGIPDVEDLSARFFINCSEEKLHHFEKHTALCFKHFSAQNQQNMKKSCLDHEIRTVRKAGCFRPIHSYRALFMANCFEHDYQLYLNAIKLCRDHFRTHKSSRINCIKNEVLKSRKCFKKIPSTRALFLINCNQNVYSRYRDAVEQCKALHSMNEKDKTECVDRVVEDNKICFLNTQVLKDLYLSHCTQHNWHGYQVQLKNCVRTFDRDLTARNQCVDHQVHRFKRCLKSSGGSHH